MKECQQKLTERRQEVEDRKQEEAKLAEEFTQLVGPDNPLQTTLLRNYKKRIKKSRKDENEESDEEDEDNEDSEESSDDDEGVCPQVRYLPVHHTNKIRVTVSYLFNLGGLTCLAPLNPTPVGSYFTNA